MSTVEITSLAEALADDLDAAFPDLVRTVQDGVFSGCLRMLGNRHDAEEVAQEAFLRAYRALQGYGPERIRSLRLEGWVWTIAANLCRNRYRSRSRKPTAPLVAEPADAAMGPAESAENSEIGARLARLLTDLSWPMRSAVVLRHVVGLDYDSISAALERPVGTVKADVHRGLARLRARLTEETP